MNMKKIIMALTFIGVLIFGSLAASAADVIKLKAVGSHGKSPAWQWEPYEKLIERVKQGTNGRVELEFYNPGQLVPFVQHLEAVRAGVMDIASVAPGYYNNEFALSNIWNFMYTDLGTDAVKSAKMWHDLYDNFMSMDFERLDLECLGGGGSPIVAYDLFTIDKPIKKYEDMKGLKLRSNSAAMSAMHEAAGAIPVFMGGGAVPDALSKNMLNGVPMSDHWGSSIPIWEHGKPGYWTITGSYPQGVSCLVASNRRNTKWTKKVSEADKEVIRAAFKQYTLDEAKNFNAAAARFKKEAIANGMILSEWPESEKQRFKKAWEPLVGEAISFAKKEGAPAKYMMEAMDKWIKDN
jgi:TRAP-type C4-dicarboxylate transport system substrate-binding protein